MRQCEEVCISAPARSVPCPWAAARMVRPYQCRRSSLQLRESDSDARERSAHVHECSGTTRQAVSVGPNDSNRPRAWAERRFGAIGLARLGATREPRNNTTQLICVYLLSKPHGISSSRRTTATQPQRRRRQANTVHRRCHPCNYHRHHNHRPPSLSSSRSFRSQCKSAARSRPQSRRYRARHQHPRSDRPNTARPHCSMARARALVP